VLVAIPAKVRREIAAAELRDCDRLTFASAFREAVAALEVRRPERLLAGYRPGSATLAFANSPSRHPTLVEPEHAGDDAGERARDLHVTLASTDLSSARGAVHAEPGRERGLDLGRRAAHDEAARRGRGVTDGQAVAAQHTLDRGRVVRADRMVSFELLAGEA